jgi:uncharacterized protein
MSEAAFHEGELVWQRREGSMSVLAEAGPRVMRDHMPEQHRTFFAQLPFVVIGALDAGGHPWATIVGGAPGFAHSPDPRQLVVQAELPQQDPLASALRAGTPVGLLGIEPHTRRRNRLNGHIAEWHDDGFMVRVDQSFGNCPKYIQARRPEYIGGSEALPAQTLDRLDEAAARLISQADTFFIASAHPSAATSEARASGVDVSHRGGKPGFVRVDSSLQLTIPDFAGNSFFNTLGNIELNPRCGLLFADFGTGDLLHVAAMAEILAAGPELEQYRGAQRLLRLRITQALRRTAALPLRWSESHLSPVLAATGSWG